MATVAGVVFSITIVALALASTQYSSRVLRNFMRDRANQVVLGVFVGVYLYCLVVLRTISNHTVQFVPSLAVIVAVFLAVLASGFLIFFIHHISSSIQASETIAAITRETLKVMDQLFPEEAGAEHKKTINAQLPHGMAWFPLQATNLGYIQGADTAALIAFAKKNGTVIRMECMIGDFITSGRPLASLLSSRPPGHALIAEFNGIFAIGNYRTIDQDAAFGIRQLVDIALKALSPGINDVTTATICIDHLTALMERCAPRYLASLLRYDDVALRLIANRPDFETLLSLSFDQIREAATDNPDILLRLLEGLRHIASATHDMKRLHLLLKQVEAIEIFTLRHIESPLFLARFKAALAQSNQLFETRGIKHRHGTPKA